MTTTAKKKTTKKDPLELPLKPFAFEVLHLLSKQRSKAKKIEVLKRYEDHIGPEDVFGIAEKNYDPDEEIVSLSENIDKNHLLC